MFVFEFLIWNSFFTGQLALNPFSYYFENFFYITASLVNYQLMLTPKYSHVHVTTQAFHKLKNLNKRKN